jgi:hypothetical protein
VKLWKRAKKGSRGRKIIAKIPCVNWEFTEKERRDFNYSMMEVEHEVKKIFISDSYGGEWEENGAMEGICKRMYVKRIDMNDIYKRRRFNKESSGGKFML